MFFAAIDSILADDGNILPTASREFRCLVHRSFLILNIFWSYPRPAERAIQLSKRTQGVGNCNAAKNAALQSSPDVEKAVWRPQPIEGSPGFIALYRG